MWGMRKINLQLSLSPNRARPLDALSQNEFATTSLMVEHTSKYNI